MKILEKGSIGFSKPKYFNDPFDLPTYPSDPDNLRTSVKNWLWAEHSVVLALTRTPTNALMWAHYADQHRGVVIGIDVSIAGLCCEQNNIIPAQYGSVIYVSKRPNQPFITKATKGLSVGVTHSFPREHYEKLQRLFLYKPICWAYEEEVRVVKCLERSSADTSQKRGQFKVARVSNRPLHLLPVPRESVREIYLGARLDPENVERWYSDVKQQYRNMSVYQCKLNQVDLSVDFDEYSPFAGRSGSMGIERWAG
jgi:hypothetical protein